MTWTEFETLDVIAEEWTFSAPVVGKFFRIRHAFTGLPDFYFRGRIAQAQLQGEYKEIYEQRSLAGKPELEIFEFIAPAEFVERRIAVQGPRGELPPIPWAWQITIEVSDFIEEEGGAGGGTSAGAGLSPWQIKTADYTAMAGDRILANTASASWTLTLPGSPSVGDTVLILGINDLAAQPLSINLNGEKFQGAIQVISLRGRYSTVEFVYISVNQGWIARPQGQLTTSNSAICTFATVGDINGALYYIGTNYGAGTWSNPHTAGRVTVTPSSGMTAAVCVDRTPNPTNYTTNAAGSWVAVDLGAGNSLFPNHYALQHDGETGYYMRNWKIQGSKNVSGNTVANLNAATWDTLDTRTNNTTIAAPNAWVNYPILSNNTSYRWLRLLSTGPSSNNDNYLMLGEFEFYGSFTHLF